MSGFEIHPQLQKDCHFLGQHGACYILLHRNAGLPWYIVVPECQALELDELDGEERIQVDAVTDVIARFLKAHHQCQRSNVAAIGNRVPQLHIHVVGRWQGDPCWPDVVWGNLPDAGERDPGEVEALWNTLQAYLK